MLLSAPHLFSTFNGKFHFQSSPFFFSSWWYLHFFFWREWEKSSRGRRFWLTFSTSWVNAQFVPPDGSQTLLRLEMWAWCHPCGVSWRGGVTTSSCWAPQTPLLSPWWDSNINTGISGWEGLSLEKTSLDLGALELLILLMMGEMEQKALSSQSKSGWWKVRSSLIYEHCRGAGCADLQSTSEIKQQALPPPPDCKQSKTSRGEEQFYFFFYYLFNILDGGQCFSMKYLLKLCPASSGCLRSVWTAALI